MSSNDVPDEAASPTSDVDDLLDQSTPAGLIAVDPSGRILGANERARTLLDTSAETMVDRRLADFLADDSQETLDLFLSRGLEQTTTETCELQMSTAADHRVDVLSQCRQARLDERPILVVSLNDMTAWRDAQPRTLVLDERLRRAQKLESLGRISSGIAHDFNNLLTLMTGYGRMLLDGADPGTDQHAHLRQIEQASRQATELVGQLLAVGRDGGPDAAVVDLNDFLVDFEPMIQRITGPKIDSKAHLDPDLPNIRINPGQLHQVMLNLTINARDAMADGGQLCFETTRCQLGDQRRAGLHELPDGSYAQLSVRDTGCGIESAVVSQIFEPFFTTKDVSQGTGLGLATARSIVREYGGEIVVDTQPGQGSCFDIYLPRADSSIDRPPETSALAAAEADGAHILLVEGHDGVRRLLCDLLGERGYRVDAAGGADVGAVLDALDDGAPAVAIVDLGLPKPTVDDLVDRLGKHCKSTQILFLAGDHTTARASRANHVLAKPFTPKQLIETIRQVLAER